MTFRQTKTKTWFFRAESYRVETIIILVRVFIRGRPELWTIKSEQRPVQHQYLLFLERVTLLPMLIVTIPDLKLQGGERVPVFRSQSVGCRRRQLVNISSKTTC